MLGTEVSIADAFRFKGALPEVANCRLAMLGELLLVLDRFHLYHWVLNS